MIMIKILWIMFDIYFMIKIVCVELKIIYDIIFYVLQICLELQTSEQVQEIQIF